MPSFLGRIFGVSFRTELLIMNIIGLVNSTLDWSPLKWTNKLEQIWNLSIPQKSLIVDTIGEDTIKTVLSWIVITRIVIAHVYTFTYLSNIYPIITRSRPNLQLPWLILSFFKNFVLEVVVIVIGLLLWYGNPFSLVVFLEFIFVKLAPLVLASYNWYSNSCFFLQLRQTEKMKKLKRSMRSDSNLLTNQLYVKIEDPKYRTGSLTSLFSFDSYGTYDPRLTPGQNAKKLFGITEAYVKDVQARIKERQTHERLTELDDDFDFGIGGRKASIPYFLGRSIYEYQDNLYFPPTTFRDLENLEKSEEYENTEITDSNTSENFEENENFKADGNLNKSSREKKNEAGEKSEKKKSPQTDEISTYKENKETQKNTKEMRKAGTIKIPKELKIVATIDNPEEKATTTEVLTRLKKDKAEVVETQKKNDEMTCSSCHVIDTKIITIKKEVIEVLPTRQSIKNTEESPSPVKMHALFNCNCPLDDTLFKGNDPNCCKMMDMRTSTPRSVLDDNEQKEAKGNSEKSVEQSYTYAYNVTNIKTDFTMNSDSPLMEKLLKNDLEILKSVKTDDEEGQKSFIENLSATELGKIEEDLEMEKKWNLFAGQTNLETLLRAAFPREDHEINKSPTNTKMVHPLIDESSKLETMLDTSRSPFSWTDNKEDNSSPPKIQEDSQLQLETPLRTKIVQKPVAIRITRSVHTQTEETIFSRGSNRSTMDPKSRRKSFFRRKPSKDQNGSVSSMNSSRQHSARKNYRPPYFRNKSNTPALPKSPSNDCKKYNLSKSSSNKSICECKTQKLEAKYCPLPDFGLNRQEGNRKLPIKPKIDSMATLPLSQVTRQSEANQVTFKKKPPLYPKNVKKEPQSVVLNETTRKPIFGRKIETESKKSMDKQPVNNSKTAKSRNRGKIATEEQAARELRALKAYNEITLLKDKKEMEVKKRIPNREPSKRIEDFRSSYKRNNPRNDMGKENLSTDAATETVISVSYSKNNRSAMYAENRLISGSNEKSSYSKSPNVNKIKDRILDNFDRLYEKQTMVEDTRERVVADLYSRKEYANYSLNKFRQTVDVIRSPSSSMKLEGAQKGRDLERTEAKEDVRDRVPSTNMDAASLEVRSEEQGRRDIEPIAMDSDENNSNVEIGNVETEDKELLTLVKKPVKEDVSSIWSSSSIDQVEDSSTGVAESSYAESQVQDLPKVEEEGTEIPEDLKSTVSTRSSRIEQIIGNVKVETVQKKTDTPQDHRKPRRPDLVDFVRNIEVTSQGNGVILSNPNAPPSKNDTIPIQWDIVDSSMVRRLNNALSYKSMDSLLDVPGEIRTVEEIINDSIIGSGSNELTHLFSNQLPSMSQQIGRFDNILITTRGGRNSNQPLEPLDVNIITIDRTNLINNSEIENIQSNQETIFTEAQLDNIPRSVAEILKSLNIDELDLENLSRSRFEILEDTIRGTEGEIIEDLQRETIDDQENDEESLKVIEEIPRLIKEDIFTDIKFPVVIQRTDIDPDYLRRFYDSPLGWHSNQVVQFVEPVALNFRGLTEIVDDDKEEAEEIAGCSRNGLTLKKVGFAKDNLGDFSRYFDAEDQSFDGNVDVSDNDEFNAEEYQSAVDLTFDRSLDPEFVSILGSPEFSEPALRRLMKENLNVTYDIIEMESVNEDIEDIEEIEGSVKEEDETGTWRGQYLYEIVEVTKSFESEEVGECSELKDNEDGSRNPELEENTLCVNIKEDISVEETGDNEKLDDNIEVGGIVEETIEERVQNKELEEIIDESECITVVEEVEETDGTEKYTETCSTEEIDRNSKIMPDIETEELEEVTSTSETEETNLEEIETVCQEKEEMEEETVRNTVRNTEERKLEDTIKFTKSQQVDKHEKEEDIKTGNSGEYIYIKEIENDIKEQETGSNIESVQIITHIENIQETEESLQLLDSCWIKSDIIIDYPEETDEDTCEEIEPFIEETEDISVSEIDQEEEKKTNDIELKEETSFKIILMFWLLVFYFYIRHFYRKMYSFTQVSRATSALKPYDVHTVSTSTSTLLEKSSLLNKLQDGTHSEDDEEIVESSINFETMNISRAIEERLKMVLDLTTERSMSRNSEFGTEEMAEEFRRETEELGLNASECITEETSLFNKIDEESSKKKNLSISELEEKINLQAAEEVRSLRFEELDRPGSSRSLLRDEVSSENIQVHEATVKMKKSVENIEKRLIKKELSLVIESKEEKSLKEVEGTSEEKVVEEETSKMENSDETKDSVENLEDSSPVQFETTVSALDSFDSLYTRPSVTSNSISFSKLDVDDMEEFSIVSSTSNEAT